MLIESELWPVNKELIFQQAGIIFWPIHFIVVLVSNKVKASIHTAVLDTMAYIQYKNLAFVCFLT